MIERAEAMVALEDAGILHAVRWAYRSAARQVAEDYSEESGHTTGWAGQTRHVLLCDRLDRVFSCKRYALGDDAGPAHGRDIVLATLTPEERDTMPALDAGLVRRSNLNHSVGWIFDGVRWLLASGPYKKLDSIRWDRKSKTKQQVARQRSFNPNQASLFDDLLESTDSFDAFALPKLEELDKFTLVLGHSQDIVSWQGELGIGSPRLASSRDSAWHWFDDLLTTAPVGGGSRVAPPTLPTDLEYFEETDAPVKLKPRRIQIQTAEEH